MDLQIENIKQIMDNLDLSALFPDMDKVLTWVTVLTRLAVMAGPLALLGFGLYFFLAAPKEATFSVGYRIRWGMGSVEAWQFTQHLAGMVWSCLGMVLTVIMAIISSGYIGMDTMPMLYSALACLSWEAGLVAVCCLVINGIVISRYDLKGERRLSWKELFQA